MSLSIKKKAIKKAVSVVTTIATVVCMSGIASFSVTSLALADVVDGALIKSNATNSDGSPTLSSLDVYIVKLVGTKKFKRLVLSPTVFNSYGHLNWGDIQTVSQSVMDEYATSALVRVDTDPDEKVYALAPENDTGKKSWVNVTAAEFLGVSGSEDGDSIYTINSTDAGSYVATGDVTTVAQLETFYSAGTLPGVVVGDLTVALSADTPVSGYIINSQATAELARFVFSGNGTVDSVSLKRLGISDQNALANVYLYDGVNRLTDGYSFNTNGDIVMNNLSIAVSGSKIITVKADVSATASPTSATISISLTSYTMTGGAANAVSLTGNTMSIVTGSLATASLSANTVTGTPTVNAGTSAYTFWAAPLQVNTRTVSLGSAAFRMIGSAPSDALSNIALFIDGVDTSEVAVVTTIQGSNYAVFDLTSSPISLTTGSHTVDVRATIEKGSNRTIQLSLQNAADLTIADSQVGVNIAVSGTIPNNAASISINTGSATVVVDPTFQSLTNVTGGTANAVIGKYKVHAYGEDVKVSSLSVLPVMTSTGTTATATATVAAGLVTGTTITAAGSGYTVAPAVTVTANDSTATATGTFAGNILTAVTLVSGGSGYLTAPVVTITQGACTSLPTATATISGGAVTGFTITGDGTGSCTNGAATIAIAAGAGATAATATATISSGAVSAITITAAGTGHATAPTIAIAAPVFTTAGGLNNVTLYLDGSQVGSQQTWPVAGGNLTYQLGSQMIVPAGTDSYLEVRADLQTTSNVNYTAGTVAATLNVGSSNAQGQNSLATLNLPTSTVTGNTLAIQTGLLVVSTNTGFVSQTASPNTAGIKIGSFILQNQATSESVRITSLVVALSGTAALTNFSALKTSETSGSGSTPVQPQASNTFSVDFTLAPGASKTIDIVTDSGTASSGTIITALTVASVGVISNVSSAGTSVAGQTITMSAGTVATPTLLTASSTPAQYIAAGSTGGSADGTKATYNFISTGGASTISELKFTVTGPNTVTSVKVGDVSAQPVAGVAYLTGLSLAVPNGGSGLTQDVFISYSEVGTSGIVPGTTSAVALTYLTYTSGGTTTTITPTITAPTMTMVGSKPTVNVTTTTSSGLNLAAENKIGEVTITADEKGNIKLNDIQFSVGSSNFTTLPTFTSARIADGTTTVIGSSCGQGTAAAASQTIFCEFATVGNTMTTTTGVVDVESNTDFDGYTIAANTSKTFSLYATVSAANTGTGTATISSSVVAAGFNWDDASYPIFVSDGTTASPANGTNLSGTSIYNFPTGSYTIEQ